tara:strand:+ start:494 stop:1012 length:519 start_codon:yes stop_codon:yes gene_type:complete
MKYQVIDNFLDYVDLHVIQNFMFKDMDWYYSRSVASDKDSQSTHYYFAHQLFDFYQTDLPDSPFYKEVLSRFGKAFKRLNMEGEMKALIRVKANLFPSTPKLVEHDFHIDYPFQHKGLLFSVNTCDGYTKLDDGTKIDSIENRLLLFDSSKNHASTTCTNTHVRVNMNFNYF